MRAHARAIGAAEGVSRRCLHLVNLPASTDVRGMREQLARMERRIASLGDEIAALEAGGPPAEGRGPQHSPAPGTRPPHPAPPTPRRAPGPPRAPRRAGPAPPASPPPPRPP